MIRTIYTFPIKTTRLRSLVVRRNFTTHEDVAKHDQFVKNFEPVLGKEDPLEGSNYTIEAVKDRSRKPKERFQSYQPQENDMYSNKPVWQQLNEIENTWKMKFKYKSRIEAQRKISKAKKSTETLGQLEANPSRLVEIGAFRPKEIEEPKKEEVERKEKKTFLTNVEEGTQLINDLNLTGDAYYEKLDMNKTEENKELSPESIKPEKLLTPEEKSLLTEIFGKEDDTYIDATKPSAIIESTTKLETETWINMDPNQIIIQQDILKSKNTTQILSVISEKLNQMNEVNVTTAIHRLAKYSNTYNRYTVVNQETFGKLIAVAENHILKLDAQGLTNMLWSVIKLKITPKWMDCLLEQINTHANSLKLSEIANCLFCLSKLTRANEASLELRFKILSMVQDKITQFNRPLDLTCLSTALARLNVRNPILFGQISSKVISNLNEFKIQEICGVAWAYASLGFTDHELFNKIKHFIENNADQSNVGNIVHLAWALSKTREGDQEFFLYTISPLVRSHLAMLNCKHITTIAWAYVNAGVEDEDLFNDIGNALIHHVDEMTTHDVAASVVAFSHLESHKVLLKKIKKRASLMLNEFTPLQLSKIVAGFAGIGDESFYNHLAKVVDAKLHLMSPENIVEILSGFTNAKVLSIPLFTKLLTTVAKSCKKMYAEDSLLLLELMESLKGSNVSTQLSKLLSNLSENLIEQIDQRVSKWKCFDITEITTLFKCLKLGDGSTNIMNTLAKQLVSCLNRVYKSDFEKERKKEIFVDFLMSTSELQPNCLNILRTQLAKDTQLMKSFNNFMTLIKMDPEDASSQKSVVNVLHRCTVLGFSDQVTRSLFDELAEQEEELKFKEDVETMSKWIWSMVESSTHVKLSIEKIKEISEDYDFKDSKEDLDSLVRLMWSCVVLSEDELLMEFAKILEKFKNLFPSEVLYAQQVALHLLKIVNNQSIIFNEPVSIESGRQEEGNEETEMNSKMSKEQRNVLKEWLEYQREDLYTKNRKSKKIRALELDHDSLISENLIKMKIPHKTLHIVENIYRISVSFPVENQLLDVVGYTDVLVPEGKVRASTVLRQRQLQLLGYGLHTIRVSALHEAASGEKAKNLIAETISSFNPLAKEHISFSKMEVTTD